HVAFVRTRQGRLDQATEDAQRAVELAKASGDLRAQARAHRCVSDVARQLGRSDAWRVAAAAALSAFREAGDASGERRAVLDLIHGLLDKGELDSARALVARAIQPSTSEDTATDSLLPDFLFALGFIELEEGRLDFAADVFRDAL